MAAAFPARLCAQRAQCGLRFVAPHHGRQLDARAGGEGLLLVAEAHVDHRMAFRHRWARAHHRRQQHLARAHIHLGERIHGVARGVQGAAQRRMVRHLLQPHIRRGDDRAARDAALRHDDRLRGDGGQHTFERADHAERRAHRGKQPASAPLHKPSVRRAREPRSRTVLFARGPRVHMKQGHHVLHDDLVRAWVPCACGWCGRTAEGIPECGHRVMWKLRRSIHAAQYHCTGYPHFPHIQACISEPFTPV